jgi:hypothetical protein
MFTAKNVSRTTSAPGRTRQPRPVPPVARRSAQASLGRAFLASFRSQNLSVSPNLACIPQRYHAFVSPAVRPLFIDASELAALRDQLSILEDNNVILKKDRYASNILCRQYAAKAKDQEIKLEILQSQLKEFGDLARKEKEDAIRMNDCLRRQLRDLSAQLDARGAERASPSQNIRRRQELPSPEGALSFDEVLQQLDERLANKASPSGSTGRGIKRTSSDSPQHHRDPKRPRTQDS